MRVARACDGCAAGLRKALHAIIAAAAPLAPNFPDPPLLRAGRHIINRGDVRKPDIKKRLNARLNEIGRHASLEERADVVCRELALGGVRAPRRRVLEVLRNVDAEDGKAASAGTVRDHVPMRVTNRVLSLLHERGSSVERAERRVKAMQVKDGGLAPSDGRELEYVATGFLPRKRELHEYASGSRVHMKLRSVSPSVTLVTRTSRTRKS